VASCICQIGLLQIGVDSEQRRAGLRLVALAHRQRLHPAGLVRAHEDEIGLDPALEGRVGAGLATRHEQRERQRDGDAA
jgi:hypothetical protein